MASRMAVTSLFVSVPSSTKEVSAPPPLPSLPCCLPSPSSADAATDPPMANAAAEAIAAPVIASLRVLFIAIPSS
jgi:hypothetical protein